MIQSFDVQGGPELGFENLPKLRAKLKALKLDGFLIPHDDEYQNEYLPACNERLMWASGYTGSAGSAVVMHDRAAIFVDGRYTLQVRSQVDGDLYEYCSVENNGQTHWLKANVTKSQTIGYDPKLHSPRGLQRLKAAVESAGGTLKAVKTNPIDSAWLDRPAPPAAKVLIQPLRLAGENIEDKTTRIGTIIANANADCALITAPASIAWLLNIRGGDVACTPLPLSTALIHKDGSVDLYINPEKIEPNVRAHLGNKIAIHAEPEIDTGLARLNGKTVIVDPAVSSSWYFENLKSAGAKILQAADPIAIPKACKNDVELEGTAQAHIRDGAAVVKFLHWLDTEAQSGEFDEIAAVQKLEGFRAATGQLKDLSFETISGAGANGAIVHYRVSQATTAKLSKGSLFLVDSGGQYVDGTTDITRTVPIGSPSAEMRHNFTLVLKGHIALARVCFPPGTSGHQLDALARAPLWQEGLDYDHGTGHGVGVFLGVHEGPQRIAKTPNTVALRPGMIVSNEPGFYKAGEYGIRIENLQYVHEVHTADETKRAMLGFKTLTLAPLHKGLIETASLTQAERDYVDSYHSRVWQELSPLVESDVKLWLEEACKPLIISSKIS